MNRALYRALAAIVTLAGCASDHASDTPPVHTNHQVLVVTGFDDEGGIRTRMLGTFDTMPVGYQFVDSAAGTTIVWPRTLLCAWAQSADRRAPVFLGAAESGALRECTPPIHATVVRWMDAADNDAWVASVVFHQPLHPGEVRELFESWRVVPVGLHGAVASHPLIVRVPVDSATMVLFSRFHDEARLVLTRTICGFPDALQRRAQPPASGDAQIAIRRDTAFHLDSTWVLHDVGGSAPSLALPPSIVRMDSAELFEALRLEAQAARTWCDR